MSLHPDPGQDVPHVPEDHLQAAGAGGCYEPAGRAGYGVSLMPGLHGNIDTLIHIQILLGICLILNGNIIHFKIDYLLLIHK